MGALTSKLYAYKARPWEIRSIETISLQDPFFTAIKLEIRDKNVLRILPVIGVEEWLNDTTRFFVSKKPFDKPFEQYHFQTKFLVENLDITETTYQYEHILIAEAVSTIVNKITKHKNVTIIFDDNSDAHLISKVRQLDTLKQFINISATRTTLQLPVINLYSNFNFSTDDNLLTIKGFESMKNLLEQKLINYHQLTLDNLSQVTMNFIELIHYLEGKYSTGKNKPIFAIANSISPYIPHDENKFLKFVIGSTNQALTCTPPKIEGLYLKEKQETRNQGRSGTYNFLTMDSNIHISDIPFISNPLYRNNWVLFNSSLSFHQPFTILIPIIAHILIKNTFINIFGKPVQTKEILLSPSKKLGGRMDKNFLSLLSNFYKF